MSDALRQDARAQTRDIAWRELRASGQLPASTAVLAEIGRGSLSTITSELRKVRAEWEEEQRRQSVLPDLPAPFAQYAAPFLQSLWADAYRQAQAEFAPLQQAWSEARQALQARLAECEDQLIAGNEHLAALVREREHAERLAAEKARALEGLQTEHEHLRRQGQADREEWKREREALEAGFERERAAAAQALRQQETRYSLLNDELIAERQQSARELARLRDGQQAAQRDQALLLDQLRQKTALLGTELALAREQLAQARLDAERQAERLGLAEAESGQAAQALKAREAELAAARQEAASARAAYAEARHALDGMLRRLAQGPDEG